jgi:hypothetical protein
MRSGAGSIKRLGGFLPKSSNNLFQYGGDDNNAFLQHPALFGAVDFWEAYAEHLAAIFAATVTRTGTNPPPVANPLYRFVQEVVPSVIMPLDVPLTAVCTAAHDRRLMHRPLSVSARPAFLSSGYRNGCDGP